MKTPRIAITMGDPAGIGPETIVGAWSHPAVHRLCRAVVVGHPAVLRRAAALLGSSLQVIQVDSPDQAVSTPQTLPCLPCGSEAAADVPPAVIDPRGGQAAYDALVCAARLALDGRVDAITTAPLNKAALWAAGHRFPGHTELLAELCGVAEVAMMLYLAPGEAVCGRVGLGVVHVTLHTALRNIFQQLSPQAIVAKARLADQITRRLLAAADRIRPGASPGSTALAPPCPALPRIGICALNPHAGEQGLFGDEEQRVILPAVKQLRDEGLLVEGPQPADTLLVKAAAGEFDSVVAMYHDQGHIALKLLGMHRAVNITLGLPIIRTSVAHGTAFDRAWQGQSEVSGMIEALKAAANLSG